MDGWEPRLDESSGQTYYENALTGETSWELPKQQQQQGGIAQSEGEEKPRRTKKLDAERKKWEAKESAMKADINRMKAETRQAKKELAEAKRQCEKQIRELNETMEMNSMLAEDQALSRAETNVVCYGLIIRGLHERDVEIVTQGLQSLSMLEKSEIEPLAIRFVQDAISMYQTLTEKITRLEQDLEQTRDFLALEKKERARENQEWKQVVEQKDLELAQHVGTIERLEKQIEELNHYIAESEERHRQQLERQRVADANTIAMLEAELELSKIKREEDLESIAEMWADDMAPPTILRPYVVKIRNAKAQAELERKMRDIRVGTRVMCWHEESMEYFPGTVTAMEFDQDQGIQYFQVRWQDGGEIPPIWAPNTNLYAIVDEEEKVKEAQVQTDWRLYDEAKCFDLQRPRTARGLIDPGAQHIDRMTTQALMEKANRELVNSIRKELESPAKRLFKMLDSENQGEISYHDAWKVIQGSDRTKEQLSEVPKLAPMGRAKHFRLAWESVEPDLGSPIVWREFLQVCVQAYLLSRRITDDFEIAEGTAQGSEPGEEGVVHLESIEHDLNCLRPWIPSQHQVLGAELLKSIEETRAIERELSETQSAEFADLEQLHEEYQPRLESYQREREGFRKSREDLGRAMESLVSERIEIERKLGFEPEPDSVKHEAEPLPNPNRAAFVPSDGGIPMFPGHEDFVESDDGKSNQYARVKLSSTNSSLPFDRVVEVSEINCTNANVALQSVVEEMTQVGSRMEELDPNDEEEAMDRLNKAREDLEIRHRVKSKELQSCMDLNEAARRLKSTWEDHNTRLRELEIAANHHEHENQGIVATCRYVLLEVESGRRLHEAQDGWRRAKALVCDQFVARVKSSTRTVEELLDQKEILLGRLEWAEAGVRAAQNEMESKKASAHLEKLKERFPSEIDNIETRLKVEMDRRLEILREWTDCATRELAITKAARAASDEKRKFRDLMVSKSKLLLDDADFLDLRHDAIRREQTWTECLQHLIKLTNGISTGRQAAHLERELEHVRHYTSQQLLLAQEKQAFAESETVRMRTECEAAKSKQRGVEAALSKELDVLTETFNSSVRFLRKELDELRAELEESRRLMRECMDMQQADFSAQLLNQEDAMKELRDVADRRERWALTLKRDLEVNKRDMEKLSEQRAQEQKRHVSALDAVKQRFTSMSKHAARLETWIQSLKHEVNGLNEELMKRDEKERRIAREHDEERMRLKWELWKRDETARVLGTNIDFAFVFFMETLSRLVGNSDEYNERFAANGGIEALLALSQASSRPTVRRLALHALSGASWNGHRDFRMISRSAHEDWKRWVHSVSAIAKFRLFKDAKQGRKIAENPRDEEDGSKEVGNAKLVGVKAGYTVRTVRNEPIVLEEAIVRRTMMGLNVANQRRMGRAESPHLLAHMLGDPDPYIRRYAVKTLSVLSLDDENKSSLGRVENILNNLLLLASGEEAGFQQNNNNENRWEQDQVDDDKEETFRYALSTISNLLHQNVRNQESFSKVQGVSRLLDILRSTNDYDVMETGTAALLSATSENDANSLAVSQCENGLQLLIEMCRSSEQLDDIGNRIQANAAACLVNATNAFPGHEWNISSREIKSVVHLCASPAKQVQRCAGLVLGNLAQNDSYRRSIGDEGGIEALFVLVDVDDDLQTQANALWALSNLAWNDMNQNRIGKHLPRLIERCANEQSETIRQHALAALAQCMYYHEGNRKRLFHVPDAVPVLCRFVADQEQPAQVVENALRALGTASHNDANALMACRLGVIPNAIKRCYSPNIAIQRFAAFTLGNLAIHDEYKAKIVAANAIEALTHVLSSNDPHGCEYAKQALEILADLSPNDEEMEEKRKRFGVQGLVQLCLGLEDYDVHGNPLPPQPAVQALACEKLANEDVRDILRANGHEALLQVLRDTTLDDAKAEDVQIRKLQQHALWALRHIVCAHPNLKTLLGAIGAVPIILKLLAIRDSKCKYGPDVVEAALAVLFQFVQQHEENSRKVFTGALDELLYIAENRRGEDEDESNDANAELALQILQVMGPYSYLECRNCKSKQKSGKTCSNCGRKLRL